MGLHIKAKEDGETMGEVKKKAFFAIDCALFHVVFLLILIASVQETFAPSIAGGNSDWAEFIYLSGVYGFSKGIGPKESFFRSFFWPVYIARLLAQYERD